MNPEIETAGRYVVGTDGSERANKAVEWAAERAAARSIPLLILTVAPEPPLSALESANEASVQRWQEERERRHGRIEQIAADLRGRHPGLEVTGAAITGNPAEVLAEASRDAEQVVVGARGQDAPLAVRLLGGVADAVTTHAHGPIAVIGDAAHETPEGPVVVGVDDSPAAREAVRIGFDAAQTRGVPLILVSAGEGVGEDAAEAANQEQVRQLIAEQVAAYPGVQYEIRTIAGRPRDVLVELSKGAGLVVVGSRGRGGFAGLLLGSTSKHVLRESFAPVLVTRG